MDINVIDIVQGFLLSAAGIMLIIVIGRYLWNRIGELVKETPNTLDDKLYTITPKIVREVLDEFELGVKTEKILSQIFIEHRKVPADTSKMEQAIRDEAEKAAKKSS